MLFAFIFVLASNYFGLLEGTVLQNGTYGSYFLRVFCWCAFSCFSEQKKERICETRSSLRQKYLHLPSLEGPRNSVFSPPSPVPLWLIPWSEWYLEVGRSAAILAQAMSLNVRISKYGAARVVLHFCNCLCFRSSSSL